MGRFFLHLILILGQIATCGLGLPLPRLMGRQAPYNISAPMQEIGSGPDGPNDPHYCCNMGADTNGVLQIFCMYDWYGTGQDYDGGGSGEEHSHDFDHPYHPKVKWDIPQPVALECVFSRKYKRSGLQPRHKHSPDHDGDSDEWGMPEGGRDYAGHSVDPARTNVMGWPAPIGAHYKSLKRSLAAAAHVVRAQFRPWHDRPRAQPMGLQGTAEKDRTSTMSVSSSGPVPHSAMNHLDKIHRRGDEPFTEPNPPYHLAPVPPANITPYDLDPHHEVHHSSSEDSEDDTRPFPIPHDRPHRPHYPMDGGEMPEDAPVIQTGLGGPPPEVVRLDGKKVLFPWDTNADVRSREHGPYDRVKRHEKLPPNPPGITGDPLLIDEEDIPGLNEFEEEQLELLRHNSDLSTMPAWGGNANYERNNRLVRRWTDWGSLAAAAAAAKIDAEVAEEDVEDAVEAAAWSTFMEMANENRIRALQEAEATPSVVLVTATAATDKPTATSSPSGELTVLVIVSDLPATETTTATAAPSSYSSSSSSSSSVSSTCCTSAQKSKETKGPSFIHRWFTKWAENFSHELAEEAHEHDRVRDWIAKQRSAQIPTPSARSSASSSFFSSSSPTTSTTTSTTTVTAAPAPATITEMATVTAIPSSSSPSISQPSAQAKVRLGPRVPEHLYYYHQYNKYADEEALSTALITVTARRFPTSLSTSTLSILSSPAPVSTIIATVTALEVSTNLSPSPSSTSTSSASISTVIATVTAHRVSTSLSVSTLSTSPSPEPLSTVTATVTALTIPTNLSTSPSSILSSSAPPLSTVIATITALENPTNLSTSTSSSTEPVSTVMATVTATEPTATAEPTPIFTDTSSTRTLTLETEQQGETKSANNQTQINKAFGDAAHFAAEAASKSVEMMLGAVDDVFRRFP